MKKLQKNSLFKDNFLSCFSERELTKAVAKILKTKAENIRWVDWTDEEYSNLAPKEN